MVGESLATKKATKRKIMQLYIWKDYWEDYNLHTVGMHVVWAGIILKQRPAKDPQKDKPKLNNPLTQNTVIYGLDRPTTLLS